MKNTPSRNIIAILTIVKSNSDRARYKTAMDSMECYALQNNYTYLQLYGENFKTICEQNDIHFQRHCIVAHILKIHHYRWVLLLNADVGVVNEKRQELFFTLLDTTFLFLPEDWRSISKKKPTSFFTTDFSFSSGGRFIALL
ncbi:unnamed protein product [Cylicocyclus nassatus]|uniref:Uncharacterized protein n=1 Tax=Cylicocyclus nassatus TaxID=53992 RepID=A0AA36H912_CYLNA|nr:unnamed protein product [Cylicocyclus nassatus]